MAIFVCRKFVISIVPERTSAIFKKNALSAYYVIGIRETAVNETDRKRIPVFTEFINWWRDKQ